MKKDNGLETFIVQARIGTIDALAQVKRDVLRKSGKRRSRNELMDTLIWDFIHRYRKDKNIYP